ncbi:anti-sigma factor [Streptomyces sp. NPDC051214]|uniref:anti-sigma factor n=1 Tax=Streptomyces sp. NPDC051214 TaxID=3155282 RepID=UPI0034319436
MKHIDSSDLAELALAEADAARSGPVGAHLRQCGACRAHLDALRRVVDAARSVSPADVPTPPPQRVWQAISAELTDDLGGTSQPRPLQSATAQGTVRREPTPGDGGSGPKHAPSVRHAGRRSALLLAAACLLVGAALGSAATRWQLQAPVRQDSSATARSGADATLAPLAVDRARGVAHLVVDGSAHKTLRIKVKGLPSTEGYFEVWLMDSTHKKLIAVGVLGADGSATLPLPQGVNLSGYPVVDVSDQAYDGDPAHSGKSVVRGAL